MEGPDTHRGGCRGRARSWGEGRPRHIPGREYGGAGHVPGGGGRYGGTGHEAVGMAWPGTSRGLWRGGSALGPHSPGADRRYPCNRGRHAAARGDDARGGDHVTRARVGRGGYKRPG